MATFKTYTKTIVNKNKFGDTVSAMDNYLNWSAFGPEITINFSQEMTAQQIIDLDDIVNNWVDFTTAETLTIYLDDTVFPFIKNLINVWAAENIAQGITQLGKTGPVLGLFVKSYDVNSNGLPLSLRDCFDSGSLYEALKVIQHLRDNDTEFAGLSPFITDARLLQMKNDIETFLGITPLST